MILLRHHSLLMRILGLLGGGGSAWNDGSFSGGLESLSASEGVSMRLGGECDLNGSLRVDEPESLSAFGGARTCKGGD